MPHLPSHFDALPRRERERLLRRQTMLAAARDVFAERGYMHATLEEVAERAEFGKGTLYNYFPGGKEELLRSVLDDLFDELETFLEPLLQKEIATTTAFREALQAYLARCARFFFLHQDILHLVMREAWRLQLSAVEESRHYLHTRVKRSVTAMGAFLEGIMAKGVIRPLPARSLAHIILTSVSHHVVAQEVAGWPDDPAAASDEAAAFLTTLLMEGLRP